MIVEKTCIMCPLGCQLRIETTPKGIFVTGNACPRGVEYGVSEVTNPVRTLTTLVRFDNRVFPVRTTKPIPKELIAKALAKIDEVKLTKKPRFHEVILKNLLDTGADVIVTRG